MVRKIVYGLSGMRMVKKNQKVYMLMIKSKIPGYIGMMMVIKNLRAVMIMAI